LNRRLFILGLLAASAFAAPALAEQFPIFKTDNDDIPYKFRQRVVPFKPDYAPGTIVVDTKNRFLYFVQGGGKAMRYGIGVGREGFAWSGEAVIGRKAKWPKWTPPKEMVARDKLAARFADGYPPGLRNPLGARALYLFQGKTDTLYRIHGTSVPSSIGKRISSGCIRMLNIAVADLFERAPVGTKVVVLQDGKL
jgi:lipoprotein-anchoring transpeptidase ErfK/SrfK